MFGLYFFMSFKTIVSRGELLVNYEISITGEIRSTITGLPIKDRPHEGGYLITTLSVKGRVLTRYVHRLVAETYIENPENKPQVNHIDGDKKNNIVSNLEWSTGKENLRHLSRSGKAGCNGKIKKLTPEQVLEIRKNELSLSIKSLSEKYCVSARQINFIIKGKHYKKVK